MKNKIGIFYGVGVGPGDPELLTLKAVKVLQSVDVIFEATGKNSKSCISANIANTIQSNAEKVRLIFSMSLDKKERSDCHRDIAETVAKSILEGKNCAFITIGDPLIYSTYIYLMREVRKIVEDENRAGDIEIKTVPGITSYQAAAAKLNYPLVEDQEKLCVIPAFDEESLDAINLPKMADTLVCLKTYKTKDKIIDFLSENGYSDDGIFAAKVGHEDEVLVEGLSKAKSEDKQYLSLIIAKKLRN